VHTARDREEKRSQGKMKVNQGRPSTNRASGGHGQSWTCERWDTMGWNGMDEKRGMGCVSGRVESNIELHSHAPAGRPQTSRR
jgi:hypothetical protein